MVAESAWYLEAFRLDYRDVYSHRDAAEAHRQLDFFEAKIDLPDGAVVLDLGCGMGRHSAELARRSYVPVGLELVAERLREAYVTIGEADGTPRFIRADMRRIPLRGAVDAVVSFFTSFGYFVADAENAGVLREVGRVLRPGGRFLLDYLNREQVIRSLVPQSTTERDGVTIHQERWVDLRRGRVEKQVTLERGDDRRGYAESVRMFTLPELEAMLDAAALTVDAVHGDFDGQPLTLDSPRVIVLASKRETSPP